ncbi:MAG: hypothetical protein AAF703_04855 [Cyanobacteria bacterium P01_D01_bin.105]
MQSFREPAESAQPKPSVSVSVPVDLALVAGTVPLLALVIGARVAANGLIELGRASEELFRGDRLPSRPLMGTSEYS